MVWRKQRWLMSNYILHNSLCMWVAAGRFKSIVTNINAYFTSLFRIQNDQVIFLTTLEESSRPCDLRYEKTVQIDLVKDTYSKSCMIWSCTKLYSIVQYNATLWVCPRSIRCVKWYKMSNKYSLREVIQKQDIPAIS